MARCAATLCLTAGLLLAGCSSDSDKKPADSPFDRGALLTHVADQFILPGYQALESQATALQDSITAFLAAPTDARLTRTRLQWEATALTWQPLGAFDFGPANTTTGTLSERIATFPVDTLQVEAYISAQDFSLNNFDRDTRGLYAIEYLLYRYDAAAYSPGSARGQYLSAVAGQLKSLATEVRQQWSTSYRNTFVTNTGTDAGSSISLLFNQMVFHFEQLKNFKLGLPLGLRASQTSEEPTRVEAFFSGKGLELAKAHFAAIDRLWRGRSATGAEGPGFEEYVLATDGGGQLAAATLAQLAAVQQELDPIPADLPLAQQIIDQNPQLDQAYEELQRLTRYLKSDLSSLLGISITFASGDGD
ncbi:MAG: imelysin family protein [Sphingobacteriia bacterium]